jgi:dihydroorotate dehydrogenase (NAD+) catalytic subunit
LYTKEKFLARAGQFVVLSPRKDISVMPRPFTIVDVKDVFVSILVKVAGKNTESYSQMMAGDKVWVFGPQGTKISFEPKSKKCIFVGGGIGGAALVMPVKKAIAAGKEVSVFLGAKDKDQLAGLSFFTKMGVEVKTVLENDQGAFVTEILEDALVEDVGFSEVITCGPKLMLREVVRLCSQYGNKCQVIVEEIMACGMGSCKGCAIFGGKNGKELRHVCSDGPAFDAKWIDWTKFMPMPAVYTGGNILSKEAVKMNYTCHLGPLTLKYPTMNCSGTLDYEACRDGSMDISHLGAFVTKGLSLQERLGNPMPRVCETPSGMLNAIGLEYIGIKRFLKEILPELLKLKIPIIVNINGGSVEEYAKLTEQLNGTGIAAFEVNISCPNVKSGGMLFGKDPAMTGAIVGAVRLSTKLPVIVKLTPNVTDIKKIARAAEQAGAHIISLINTVAASAIDIWTCKPKIANVSAGLSGPAIFPIAVWNVMQVYQAVSIPIIGMGGNKDGYTAAEFMMAGAKATAFGTCGFANREIYSDAIKQLSEVALSHGFTATEKLVGKFFG